MVCTTISCYRGSGRHIHVRRLAAALGSIVLLAVAPTPAPAQTVNYGAPIVITQGGTYTGNYQSLASGVPCVRIATTAPVILDGCQLSGAGNLIESGDGASLTVRNCRGQGLAPTADNQAPGRFLDAYRAQRLVIEHNYFAQTSGIVVNRWSGTGQAGQVLLVRYNQARNIDGRWRNAGGFTRSSFLLLNTVQHLAGVDIAYNEVLNAPDQSLVEDNINLYNSSGTAASPLRVHHNFVRGAYPFPATAPGFTGTGLTTDGDASTLAEAAGYIEADHNQFVGTGNAAMNMAAGHDVYYHDNRAVTSGYLPDGRRFNAGYAALGIFNFYHQPASVFFNNRMENNTVGYVRWGGNFPFPDRQDLSPGACAPCTGTVHLPNPITPATEANELALWQQQLQQAGVSVGPAGSTPPPNPQNPPAAGTVANPGFEADGAAVTAPTGWLVQPFGSTPASTSYSEAYGGAHTGSFHGTHYRPQAYEIYTYQTVSGLPAGTYTLRAWVKSTGGQSHAELRARNYGGAGAALPIPAAGSWTQVTLPNISVSSGQCEIGFYSQASGGQWLYFDDVELVAQATTPPPVVVPPTVALSAPTSATVGQALALSATAADADGTVSLVEFFAGSTKLGEAPAAPYLLSWTPPAAGSYVLTARATDNGGASTTSAAITVVVAAAPTVPPTTAGTVANPGFEADGAAVGAPSGWQTQAGPGSSANADYTEDYGGAHTGTYHGTHWRPEPYEVYTYQTIGGLPAGNYKFSAWVKCSGGQSQVQLRARNYGGAPLSVAVPGGTWNWTLVELPNISVSSGQCEIGFYSQAGSGQWLYFDDITFVAQPVLPAAATNTVLNASFDDDGAAVQLPRQWSVQAVGSTPASASYTENYGGSHTGTYHGTHWRPQAYEIYTYQLVRNLPAGVYTLRAWIKSTGGQSIAELQARSYGGAPLSVAVPGGTWNWTLVELPNISVSNGQCEIGFYSQASGGQWLYFDDVELLQTGTAARAVAGAAAATPALYPNPAHDQVTVSASFAQATSVALVITNLQGVTVAHYQRQVAAGDNQLVVNTSELPAGLYSLQLQSPETTIVQRLEVKH